MSFSNIDSIALKKASDSGLIYERQDIEQEPMKIFFVVRLGDALYKNVDAAKILAGGLEALARFYIDSQIHLNIETENTPEFAIKAIDSLRGFGMPLIVTHNGKCSHKPSEPLEERLQLAVAKVACDGFIWHPIEKKLVNSRPL